jgi:CyaY protein
MTQAPATKLSDIEYLNQAEAALAAIERCCDTLNDSTDADIDNQRTGGMVTLTFANKSQIIINLQKPLQEIWMAARAGGFHYKFDQKSQVWRDTKLGSELFADLTLYASAQSGESLRFKHVL